MAGLGRKQWAGGELVTVGDFQGYLQDQAVMVFATAAARSAAVPAPSKGMLTFLSDSNRHEIWTGSGWQKFPQTFRTGQLTPTAWPAADPPIVTLYGTIVVTTDAGGGASITFGPFSQTIQTLIVGVGGGGGNINTVIQNGDPSLGSGGVICRNTSGAPVANTSVRINYIVAGA